MKIISIVNQKGGVGKTTTAINIAGTLSAINYRVLLIDFDPQGNASSGLGIDSVLRNVTIYDALSGLATIEKCIVHTKLPSLDIITANVDLAGAEVELVTAENREFILKKRINSIVDNYDFIIIDCPPSLGLLTINALVASDSVVVPLQCEFFALEGLAHLMDTMERIKENFNDNLTIGGVILTMYDRRNKLTENVERDVRECLGDIVYKTIIPRNVRVSEASSHGLPAILYDSECSGSIAYMKLVEEIIKKQNKE